MSPLGYLVGPLLGTLCILLGSPAYAFIILGVFVFVFGIALAYNIHDTK